jgi:hypothetical protein
MLRITLTLTLMFGMWLGLSGSSQAAFIVYSTGVDNSGNSLAGNAVDPHYALVAGPAALGSFPQSAFVTVQDGFPIGPWLNYSAGNGKSRWIEPTSGTTDNHPQNSNYTYETTFDLTGFNPASAKIVLRLASDNNTTSVLLNGSSTGITATSLSSFSAPFTISSGFVNGINHLDFVVNNGPGVVSNPTGLRVEIQSFGVAPAPPGLLLGAMGAAGLLGFTRVRRLLPFTARRISPAPLG